jgi:hypothetical protein
MSTNFTDRDRVIIEQINREFPEDWTHPRPYLAKMVQLGASDELLIHTIAYWIQMDRGTPHVSTLGWVPVLHELKGRDYTRDFLVRVCTMDWDQGEGYEFREAFWNDPVGRALFATAQEALSFAVKLAALQPNDLITKHREVLTDWFKALDPDLHILHLHQIEQEAAKHLQFIENEQELDAVLRLRNDRDKVRVAGRGMPYGWKLVLIGYLMAGHAPDMHYVESQIMDFMWGYPSLAPNVYRWIAEGYRRYAIQWAKKPHWNSPEEYWRFLLDERIDSPWIRRTIMYKDSGDWRFVRLNRNLQAILPRGTRQGTMILQHVEPIDGADSSLQEGDEVIVSARLVQSLRPTKVTPAGFTYELSLTPATPPSGEMLADWHRYLSTRNLARVDWRERH